MLNNKIEVLFFADNWDDRWRRRQQLAWGLSKKDMIAQVVYIEQPLTPTSFLKFCVGKADPDAVNRWRRLFRNRSSLIREGDKLSILTTFALLPTVGIKPLFKASEEFRDRWTLRKIRSSIKGHRPVVWVSHPQISVKQIKALDPSFIVYDCTEDFSAWPDIPECVREQIKGTDSYLTKNANLITAVSRVLYDEKKKNNPNTHWLPNAVDIDLFMQPKEKLPMPKELQDIKRPILTFVGGMCDWAHDWDLLDKVAALRPNWTIILIGGLSVNTRTAKMLNAHGNILCLGQKPYSELPNYLAYSDVCFVFYRTARENDTRNSQKLFLYLAAGKPVVSTPSADIASYLAHVCLAVNADEFIAKVEESLRSDSSDKIKDRQAFARLNSWDHRVDQIYDVLLKTYDRSPAN